MTIKLKMEEKVELVEQVRKYIEFMDKVLSQVEKVEEELVAYKLAGSYRCFDCHGNPRHEIEGTMEERHKIKIGRVRSSALKDLGISDCYFNIHLDIPDVLRIDSEINKIVSEFEKRASILEDMWDLRGLTEAFWADYEKVKKVLKVVHSGLLKLKEMANVKPISIGRKKEEELLKLFDFSEATQKDFEENYSLERIVRSIVYKEFQFSYGDLFVVPVNDGFLMSLKSSDKRNCRVVLVNLKEMKIMTKTVEEVANFLRSEKGVEI